MVRRMAMCLTVLCLAAVLFLVPATVVCASDNQTGSGDGDSSLFDTTTGIGAASLLGVGGGGAIVVSRNNRKRRQRMVRNKQVPGEMPAEHQTNRPFGPGHRGLSLRNLFQR
jgi:hypothetical protein